MITAVTCGSCGSGAFLNARGELLLHTRPGPTRFVRVPFGWERVPIPVVCEAVKNGTRA